MATVRSVEVSGLYGSLDNPLLFLIDEQGNITGPARHRVQVRNKDGHVTAVNVESTELLVEDLKKRY